MPAPHRTFTRIAAAALAFALLTSACHRAPAISVPKAIRPTGWLHTNGTHILDQSGRPVRLIGVGVRQFQPVADPAANCGGWTAPPATVVNDIASWGFNSVRVPLSWANLEPIPPSGAAPALAHHWNATYLAALDLFVRQAGERHLRVVFDIHPAFGDQQGDHPKAGCTTSGMPAWMYPSGFGDPAQAKCDFLQGIDPPGAPQSTWDGLAAAWAMLAGRYANNPTVVGADMVNEPYIPNGGACSAAQSRLGDLYQRLGTSIRAANPKLLLIFEDAGPNDAVRGTFELTGPPPFANEMYSYHLYQPNWRPAGVALDQAYWRRAQAWGVPLQVGEFNAFGYAAPNTNYDPGWNADAIAAVASWKARGISWNAWAYSGGNHLIGHGGAPRVDLIRALQTGF